MRFIDAPFYVRQMIVVSFIFTFVLAIIGLFASYSLQCAEVISIVSGNPYSSRRSR